jgi:hypothetical protein
MRSSTRSRSSIERTRGRTSPPVSKKQIIPRPADEVVQERELRELGESVRRSHFAAMPLTSEHPLGIHGRGWARTVRPAFLEMNAEVSAH